MSLGFRKLIRGGQTQLHELNMAREYLRIVYLLTHQLNTRLKQHISHHEL